MIYITQCDLSYCIQQQMTLFDRIAYHRRDEHWQAYIFQHTRTDTRMCHTFARAKKNQTKTSTQVFCSSPVTFKSLLDAVHLSPVEGSQSTIRANFSCQVVGLKACRRGHGLKWHARFNHLRFPTHSCWELDPSSVLCRVSWSVLGPCSLWGTAWTSCPRNYVL